MQARQGLKVGKCMLFFGARYKQEPRRVCGVHVLAFCAGAVHVRCVSQEWLYREEFESYEKEGVLQMHTAFSREQASVCTPGLLPDSCSGDACHEARKIYVQHRIVEAAAWAEV